MLNLSLSHATRGLMGSVLALGCLAGLPAPAAADDLSGSWGGGGKIVFPSGETESARCRASFRRQGGNSFTMSAICATASARVQQTAEVTRVTANVYRGEFFNQEHGIGGSIRITLRGDRLNASLSGGGGSAVFSLSR